jgi:hypothetical protein
MTSRRRRQTRSRRTTGFPPELHNAQVADRLALRRMKTAILAAIRASRRFERAMAALVAESVAIAVDAGVARAIERERSAAADAGRVQCLTYVTAGPMTPPHTPSPWCESGGYPHCTCSYCY